MMRGEEGREGKDLNYVIGWNKVINKLEIPGFVWTYDILATVLAEMSWHYLYYLIGKFCRWPGCPKAEN